MPDRHTGRGVQTHTHTHTEGGSLRSSSCAAGAALKQLFCVFPNEEVHVRATAGEVTGQCVTPKAKLEPCFPSLLRWVRTTTLLAPPASIKQEHHHHQWILHLIGTPESGSGRASLAPADRPAQERLSSETAEPGIPGKTLPAGSPKLDPFESASSSEGGGLPWRG